MPARPYEARFLGSERAEFDRKLQIAMKKEGNRIRLERVKQGASLRGLARAMEISAAYLCDLEKGRRPFNPALASRHAAALVKLTASGEAA